MTKSEWIEFYNQQIKNLESEFAAKINGEIQGNQAAIYSQVGGNILAEKEFNDKRRYWESKILELTDVDPGVEAFLNQKNEPSKFDIDAGIETYDTSLDDMGGKAL